MDVEKQFKSLSKELDALKDRVRHIISRSHWLTDGEWKESVLRTILRRHLPANVHVGRGFVIKEDMFRRVSSRQIDLLIYDPSKPLLHKDGDLVFVTPDAVKGIVEVKTIVSSRNFKGIIKNLADNAEFIKTESVLNFGNEDLLQDEIFVGLFAYETKLTVNEAKATYVLDTIKDVVKGQESRIINHISLGSSIFIRFWMSDPDFIDDITRSYKKWHFYEVHDMAPGYFINNLLHHIAKTSIDHNRFLWFPRESKERHLIGKPTPLYD